MEVIEKIKKISLEKVFVLEYPEELAYRFKSMVDFINKEQLRTTVGIAPYLLCNTKHSEYKEKLIRVIEESIKLCGKQGGQYIVIQPWAANQASQNGEEVWTNNREYYLHFAKLAREQNVMILLQNLCRDVRGHLVRGICADEEEAVLWVDRLNAEIGEERFGFCMDVGICNLCGQNMYDYVSKLNNRLKAVILL